VLRAKALGHQHFDFLANQFVAAIAKERLGLRIDLNNGSITIDGDYGIGQSLEEIAGEQNLSHGDG
jgi:hypothetical protein